MLLTDQMGKGLLAIEQVGLRNASANAALSVEAPYHRHESK